MFEDRELDEKLILFTDEAHFYLNGYVNKQRRSATQDPGGFSGTT